MICGWDRKKSKKKKKKLGALLQEKIKNKFNSKISSAPQIINGCPLKMLVSSQYVYHQNPGINLHSIRMLVSMTVCGVMMINGVTHEEYKI